MMTIEIAREIKAAARKSGTLKFTTEQKAEFNEASEVIHQWSMENDKSYARQFRACYNQMAVGLGRMDLVGKY